MARVLIGVRGGVQVEHPLCEVCCRGVQEEMEKDMEALREEAEAYEAALERLQADAPTPASVAELALAQQQERAERCAPSPFRKRSLSSV